MRRGGWQAEAGAGAGTQQGPPATGGAHPSILGSAMQLWCQDVVLRWAGHTQGLWVGGRRVCGFLVSSSPMARNSGSGWLRVSRPAPAAKIAGLNDTWRYHLPRQVLAGVRQFGSGTWKHTYARGGGGGGVRGRCQQVSLKVLAGAGRCHKQLRQVLAPGVDRTRGRAQLLN